MSDAIAIVLARGGSKRVPRKNARLFCGKPMVAWPVFHAMSSGLFSSIVISTDDQEIADAAVAEGASFFGPRPKELSNDFATTADVLAYELDAHYARHGSMPPLCCCLYGTSAFVTAELLLQGRDKMNESAAEVVMAVSAYSHPVERALVFEESGNINYKTPGFALARTQDIQPSYHDIGLFYWFRAAPMLQKGCRSFAPLQKTAIILPSYLAVDIDTEEDWHRAELMAANMNFADTARQADR